MKKFKINLLPIIGIMVAVATLAFTAPKDMTAANWYETDQNGFLEELPSAPEGDCDVQLPDGVECAIKLTAPISSPTLRADVDPNHIAETAFTEPE